MPFVRKQEKLVTDFEFVDADTAQITLFQLAGFRS